MTPVMDFYFGHLSGNSARSAFALAETGASYTAHRLDIHARENRENAYLSVNPMGKIPSLVDGALTLWESNAINWYLAEKFPEARLLPRSIEGRARVQRWLFFQTAHVTPVCIPLFRAINQRVKEFWRPVPDEKGAEAARKELLRYLPVLDQGLANRDWFEGEFSLADIAYTPHFALVAEGGYDFSSFPRLAAWLDRVRNRPAWKKAAQLVFGE
ncbi:MAG TPA: glutathione S-transferase family protein [Myxococcales bacterium]|nr:glutathione S-transferase family protein [Myxococcales bacterium]